MADMSTYLTTKTADYTATELVITPQNVMVEKGAKNQISYEMDDGTYYVVSLSDSYFTIQLQWDWLSLADAETILDFYHDSNKANGMENTFYWEHPLDGNTYVARFISELSRTDSHKKPNAKEVGTISIRIEGVKA